MVIHQHQSKTMIKVLTIGNDTDYDLPGLTSHFKRK